MTDEFQTTEGSESEAPRPRQRTAAGSSTHRRPGQSRSDYHFHTLIGEGSLGRVHEATRKSTGESCAIKEVRKSKLAHSPSLRQMVYEEVYILQRPALQSNPNIVKLYCSFQDEGFLYYCFELVKGGSLSKIIERLAAFRSSPVVPLHLVRLWIGELLSVVSSLNKERVVHRDIKPDNVLLADGHVRVIDFNNATARGKVMLNPEATKVNESDQEFGGTIPWWAPERVAVYKAHNGEPFVLPPGYEAVDPELGYTPEIEIDLWSVGCIMYEMLTGRNPFLRATAELTAERILRYAQKMSNLGGSAMDGLEWPSTITAEARDLCLKLLHPNPTVRLEVLQPDFETRHPFLADIHFRQLLSSVEAGDLVKNLLKSAEKQPNTKVGQISASILEFTPEIGQRFDGREIVGSLGVRNIAFAGVPSAIPEDGPADLYSSTPLHRSMRLDDLSSTTSNSRRGPAPEPPSRSSRRRSKQPPQQQQPPPPLLPSAQQSHPDPLPMAPPPTIELPVESSELTLVDTDGQGSSGRSTPDQRASSAPMPKEAVPTPETTAPPGHEQDDSVMSTGGATSSWAVEMSSDEFREFMIPFVVMECKRLVGDGVDEEEVVEAAGLLTWGPCKVSFTMAKPKPPAAPEKPTARFAVCRQVLQIDNAHPPQGVPKSLNASATVAAAVESLDMAPVGMMEDSPSAFCCAQSPSLVMFAKLRRWLRLASGFGLPEDRPSATPIMGTPVTPPLSAPPQLSQLPPAMLPLVPPPPPPAIAPRKQLPDLICFGVLTSRFGLMLFIADCQRNECHLRGCLRPAPGSRVEVKRENGPRFSINAENSLVWAEGDGSDTTRIDGVVIDVDCEEIAEKWGPHLHTAFAV